MLSEPNIGDFANVRTKPVNIEAKRSVMEHNISHLISAGLQVSFGSLTCVTVAVILRSSVALKLISSCACKFESRWKFRLVFGACDLLFEISKMRERAKLSWSIMMRHFCAVPRAAAHRPPASNFCGYMPIFSILHGQLRVYSGELGKLPAESSLIKKCRSRR